MIIGPTRLARVSFGVQPVGMKNAVMKPHAMKAAMLGMIMPLRKVPNFCTLTRAPGRAGADVVVMCRTP